MLCNPFRGRSTRFWIPIIIAVQLIFNLTVLVIYSRNSTVIIEKDVQKDAFRVAGVNLATPSRSRQHSKPTEAMLKVSPTKKASPTTKASPTKKGEIDMVNDYQPWIDFKFVYPEVQPALEGSKDLYLVVLVNSGAKGGLFNQRRAKIRETWASKKTCEYLNAANQTHARDKKWILVFVLGKVGNEEDDKRNIEEAKKHNDMLIGDIDDNYLNNILKFYMGQLWASLHGAKYTLKTDDDVYVRIPKIIEYLVSQGSPPRFYGGETYPNTAVARWAGGKWSISKKYFDEPVFPPFNAGAFILMSTDLLDSLFHYVHIRKPFHTDDAYVGVAMRHFKVKVIHILSFDIKNHMAALIRSKNNCEILKLIAYGHDVKIYAMDHLHKRVEDLCHKKITVKNC